MLAFLAIVAIVVIRLEDLFAVVMLFGIYSLLSAALFVALDAPDVAFTEAAVGAGISAVLMLATLALTERHERPHSQRKRAAWLPLGVVAVTGAFLVYGTLDMPPFGNPENPAHTHVAPRYLEQSGDEIGVPNVVTSVLASYRGYDTLGETVVIFTAGMGVLVLLGSARRLRRKPEDD